MVPACLPGCWFVTLEAVLDMCEVFLLTRDVFKTHTQVGS